jgi:hypothetical protein
LDQFYPGEKITLTYHGHLLSPIYSLRLYNFRDGDVIVATKESDVSLGLCTRERRWTSDPGNSAQSKIPGILWGRRLFVRTAQSSRRRLSA